MRDSGRIKERYDFSLDSRQLGLVLFAGLAVSALLFVLGMSVGRQWERKLAGGEKLQAAQVEFVVPEAREVEEVPAAPPVEPPSVGVSGGAESEDETSRPRGAGGESSGEEDAQRTMKPEELTFPQVLTGTAKPAVPAAVKEKKAEQPKSKGIYTVQVGAFKDKASASAFAAKLKKKGYSSGVQDAKGSSGSTIYKVHVGSFSNRGDAQKMSDRINSAEKMKSYVTSYR